VLHGLRCWRTYSKGQKNDFRDAEAIAEAVLRPTMKFGAIKTVEQLDLQGLHRVRERLVRQRTSVINQIRAFLLECGIAVRQGLRALRTAIPNVLAMTDKLSPRMIHMIEDLSTDWRYFDARIASHGSGSADVACAVATGSPPRRRIQGHGIPGKSRQEARPCAHPGRGIHLIAPTPGALVLGLPLGG
jgi:hypothetical protein